MKKMAISMVVLCSLIALPVAAWCGDNGNGTVTVNGLVWLKDARCLGAMDWNDAMTLPKSLAHGQCGLSDNSKPGDWRLPTIVELRDIYSAKGQFKAVQAYYYWSSSTYARNTTLAWYVGVGSGYVGYGLKDDLNYVWPVRAGQ